MELPVKLHVYDLSRGMAMQLSRQLTGRQIDGVWHTSIVVYGKEIFYGQGIDTSLPGRSHHGSPMEVIDMGNTSIDEETFNEYLAEMSEHYTADKYHLLDFNCNAFTNDCVGFLTGRSIPDYIKDLPTDFLSTPFGAALRPTIDAMYRRPSPGTPTHAVPPTTPPGSQLAASILQSVASQAQGPGSSPTPATETLAAPIHVITNPPAFHSFLRGHRAAVAMFTDQTCAPCRAIYPTFERLAEEKGLKTGGTGAGFAKVDILVGQGQSLASEWGIRATPTFIFYLDGKKIDELKGADANELRSQIDLLLFQAYPPHPHTTLSLPVIKALSTNPILFTQVPALDTVLNKLYSFIDSATRPSTSPPKAQVKQTLVGVVAPYLKARFTAPPPPHPPTASPQLIASWSHATYVLAEAVPLSSLFPLVDLWRLAVLDPAVSAWVPPSPALDPVAIFLEKATGALHSPPTTGNPRNYILTTLRLLSNGFSSPQLSRRLLISSRATITNVLVPSLLHEDGAVRTAAASLAFNISGFIQKGRVEKVRGSAVEVFEDEDWEVEIVSAVVEALDREVVSEEVVHRLTASLAFLLRLAPSYETQLSSLLDVLQTKEVLKRKLTKGGCGETGVGKVEVRKLIEEVAGKLC